MSRNRFFQMDEYVSDPMSRFKKKETRNGPQKGPGLTDKPDTNIPLNAKPVSENKWLRPFSNVNNLTISDQGVDFIKEFEGFRANLYNDPAGHCTIGYGTLVHKGNCDGTEPEEYKKGVTESRAKELLKDKIARFESVINNLVKVTLNQQQFDALTSFVYNIGDGAFTKSTLLKKLNGGDFAAVPVELKKWVKANGETLPGLVRRREAEANLFTSGSYSTSKSWFNGFNSGYFNREFSVPRGIRNNNPGNIIINKNNAWEGRVPVEENTDGHFEQFTSYEYGIRALIILLTNYVKSGRNTITKIFAAYAPPNENNTQSYIRFVADRLGIGPDDTLTLTKTILKALSQAIAKMENGQECISDEQFEAGFALVPDATKTSIAQSYYRQNGGNGRYNYMRSVVEEEIDDTEVEDSGIGLALSMSVPAFCSLSEADDAATDHFKLSEFHSHDGVEVPKSVRGNVQKVMNELEVLRVDVGVPINIVSGYRSPAHNKKVGGKSRSQHLCGKAADIKIKDMTPLEVRDKIEALITAGKMKQGGLGIYNTFVHYDIRGTKARWDERK